MDLSKLLEGMGLKGDGKGNAQLLKQAENMWKMLDDLAENDPTSYKQFVNSNIEQGMQAVKVERDKEIKEFTVQLDKDSYKATLQTSFKLQPSKNLEELSEFKSVVIDKKTIPTKVYEGTLIFSVFSHSKQPSHLNTSLDNFQFKQQGNMLMASVNTVFSLSDSSGLLDTPMQQAARKALGSTLGRLQAMIPSEVKKWQVQMKVPEEEQIVPKLYGCSISADQLRRLPGGYVDCKGSNQLPKEAVLDSLLADSALKSKKVSRPEGPEEAKPAEVKKEKDIIFKKESKLNEETMVESKPVQKKEGPKIEVISEEVNYESMVVEKKHSKDSVEISIEVESVESLNEIDLDISSKEIRLIKKGEG